MKKSSGYYLKNFIFVLLTIFTVVNCAPIDGDEVKILQSKNIIDQNGNYQFNTVLDNGSRHEAKGTLTDVDGVPVVTVTGTFTYYTPNGERHTYSYVANENGYVVKSVYIDNREPDVTTPRNGKYGGK